MTTTDQFCALLESKHIRYTRDGDAVRVPGPLYLTGCTSITALPDGLSTGGWLDLTGCTGLTALPDNLGLGGWLNLAGCAGLTALPDGLSVGGWLNLAGCTGLTALPDNLSVDGWLDLADCTGLTALPDNLSVGGSLYLDGCASLTSLPDGLSVGGSLYLDDDQCSRITHWRGRAVKLRYVDGYVMVMGRSRQVEGVTVHSARYFRTVDLADMKPCYVAEADGLTAHGETVEQAIRDLRFKALEHGDPEDIADIIRERGSVRMEEWRAITGACEEGTREGMEQAGFDRDADELPLPAVLSAAFGSYGDTFRRFFQEARA